MPLIRILTTCLSLLLASVCSAAPVAQIVDAAGAVSILHPNGKQVLADTRSPLSEGDMVITETNSTAVLAFVDGNKVALRPNTRFQVVTYTYDEAAPKDDNVLFRLVKGGLRTITGLIGKRGNKDAYHLRAATATIGVRGTEYTARICDGDCGEKTTRPPRVPDPAAAAKIASLEGEVVVLRNQQRIPLTLGAPLFKGDTLETGDQSFAGIVFSDNTRVVVRRNSRFLINDYVYEVGKPEQDNFAVQLLRGALRSVTGLLGKRNADRIHYSTGTVTIGIRGTRFDLWCVGSGSYDKDAGGATPAECNQGVVTAVREGRVVQENSQGGVEIGAGQSAYTDRPGTLGRLLPPGTQLPGEDGSPLPETLPAFSENPNPGNLYVMVNEGAIGLGDGLKTLELNKGEGGFAPLDGNDPGKIPPPAFLARDPFLRSVNLRAASCDLP